LYIGICAESNVTWPFSSFPGDEELLFAATYGSETVVKEIIIPWTKGGGDRVEVEFEYYRDHIDQTTGSSATEFQEWSNEFKAEVKAFADAHVLGDPTSDAYQQAHEAMSKLYAIAKIKSVDPHETGWFAANGHTFNYAEILRSLNNIEFHIEVHSKAAVAYSDVTNAMNKIYIDPTRVSTYNPFFSTATESINYLVYHELGHSFEDGEADLRNPGYSPVTIQARANQYGQVLAGINNAEYPTDSELVPFDGTPPPYGPEV
jgi:hypothetical protein